LKITHTNSVLLSKKDCRLCGKESENSLWHCPVFSFVKKDIDFRIVSQNRGSSSKKDEQSFKKPGVEQVAIASPVKQRGHKRAFRSR